LRSMLGSSAGWGWCLFFGMAGLPRVVTAEEVGYRVPGAAAVPTGGASRFRELRAAAAAGRLPR
jgi:hypothetical protein